jgi:putative transposase
MRRLRCFLSTEVYFITIRTVEERFALSSYACPGAWHHAEGKLLDDDERRAMNDRGQACVDNTKALTEEIAFAEKNKRHPRPEVAKARFTDSISNIIGSCLARGVEKFGVHLYAFVWMSNHGHLLIRAPRNNLADFMAYLNGQIAVNVNRFLGRRHQLWARRYAAAQVLEEAEELERLGYILANPQNAGIANSIEDWPGLSSAHFLIQNRVQRFLCFDRTAWYENGCPNNIAPFLSTVKLEHKILPQLARLDPKKLRRKVRRLIRVKVKPLDIAFENAQNAPLEIDPWRPIRRRFQARTLIPTDRPESPKRSRQPLCHTRRASLWRIYQDWYREFRTAHADSSYQYKLGNTDVEFPPGSFAPSRYPRARHPMDPDKLGLLHPTRRNLETYDTPEFLATLMTRGERRKYSRLSKQAAGTFFCAGS